MLNQKKLDIKMLERLPKKTSKTGTTNSGGNFYVGKDIIIISAVATGSLNRMFIPFQTGSGDVYLKALDWSNNNYAPVINGAVAVDIMYYDK